MFGYVDCVLRKYVNLPLVTMSSRIFGPMFSLPFVQILRAGHLYQPGHGSATSELQILYGSQLTLRAAQVSLRRIQRYRACEKHTFYSYKKQKRRYYVSI